MKLTIFLSDSDFVRFFFFFFGDNSSDKFYESKLVKHKY